VSIAKEPAPIMDVEGLEEFEYAGGRDNSKPGEGAKGLSAFLEGISLLMTAETRSEDESADAVRLMTMHASKGLEFDTVFITGCEDKLIPFKRDEGTGKPEDEEVRLFYVGLTRAKRKLFLCRAAKRQRFGKTHFPDPSPFLDVIRDALVGGGSARKSDAGAWAGAETGNLGEGAAQRLASHLAATGVRAGTGNTFGRGGRGGGGRGRGDRYSGRGRGGGRSSEAAKVEQVDPEAAARRAGRRAAASKKAAEAAAAAGFRRPASCEDGPRAMPGRGRGIKAPPRR